MILMLVIAKEQDGKEYHKQPQRQGPLMGPPPGSWAPL